RRCPPPPRAPDTSPVHVCKPQPGAGYTGPSVPASGGPDGPIPVPTGFVPVPDSRSPVGPDAIFGPTAPVPPHSGPVPVGPRLNHAAPMIPVFSSLKVAVWSGQLTG